MRSPNPDSPNTTDRVIRQGESLIAIIPIDTTRLRIRSIRAVARSGRMRAAATARSRRSVVDPQLTFDVCCGTLEYSNSEYRGVPRHTQAYRGGKRRGWLGGLG